jgi:AcrR family transcriptional regulator
MPRTIVARSPPATTRERILDEAERLIAVKGVYGFTLRDIAVPLGVQVPAIYKHYKSRDDVLIEVSRRFITLLSSQFELRAGLAPVAVLHAALDGLVELLMAHPAYVRLALVDFATPGGGMEYVNRAAGGSFKENFVHGPLAAMHMRLRKILKAGIQAGEFRRVDASDFYRLVKASILIRLAFPDDALLLRQPSSAEVRAAKRWLWDIAARHLARLHGNQIKAERAARSPGRRPPPRLPKR